MAASKTSMQSEGLVAARQKQLMNPDELINTAYSFHCSDDKSLARTNERRLAKRIVDEFLSQTAEPGSAEFQYLMSVRGIILTHSRALTRGKSEHNDRKKKAEEESARKKAQINSIRIQTQGTSALWKIFWRYAGPFLVPIFLGLIGVLTARILGQVVPEEVAESTGTVLPTILLSGLFILIGEVIGTSHRNFQNSKIDHEERTMKAHSRLTWKEDELRHLYLVRQQLVEAWLQYTGEKYPETQSYEMNVRAEIEDIKESEKHLLYYRRGYLDIVGDFFAELRAAAAQRLAMLRKKREQEPLLPEKPAE